MRNSRPSAVLIDVGFTLTSYDGVRMAEIAALSGVRVGAPQIEATERDLRAELSKYSWPLRPDSPAPAAGGVRLFRRILELAGAAGSPAELDGAAHAVWDQHLRRNVWARILPGVPAALQRLKAGGLRLAVVSNSEGTVEAMLAEVGLRPYFEIVIDSWVVGITKPNPGIFQAALKHLGVAPEDAVMVGDSPTADVAGAAACGMRGALLDPFDLHTAVAAPRFDSFATFADAVLQA